MGKSGKVVWSSDGDLPPEDARTSTVPAGDGVVRVSRETKGRRGKAVTVVRGAPLELAGLDDLARDLKKLCGTGGTVKDGAVEIQGDQRDRVVAALQERGWRVKYAGG
ncbi:MAG: stress response translation initiation inhibitor YciH [bacterium]|nr:stress response translation initiation inhibitor YciH [bacterium]